MLTLKRLTDERHHIIVITRPTTTNKSAQSNLGRGPRRGAIAHVRRKVPIGYNGAVQIRPKSTPSRGPIAKHQYCLLYTSPSPRD